MMNRLTQKNYYPWLVLLLSASFLFYKYVLQISPSVMTTQLMENFHLTGAGLGNLAAAYFYTYLVAQLLVGPLLDKYNTRILTALAMGLCAAGLALFSQSHQVSTALFARGLMGVGAAFATVSYLKLASVWFKPNQFAVVSGLLATAAMVGSMAAQLPMSLLVTHTDWRTALWLTSILGMVLALLFFVVVRHKKKDKPLTVSSDQLKWADFLTVLKSKNNWLLTFYSGLAFSPLAVLGGLWGNPFFETVDHFSPTVAASVSTFMFLGLAVGSPLSALLSNRLNNRYKVMQGCVWLSLLSLLAVIYAPHLSAVVVAILLFLFGLGVGAFMLGFTVAKEINVLALAATVIAFVNTGDAILGAFTEPFVGKLLDLFWNGNMVDGLRQFDASSYRLAFSVLPLYLFMASLVLLPLKKSMR